MARPEKEKTPEGIDISRMSQVPDIILKMALGEESLEAYRVREARQDLAHNIDARVVTAAGNFLKTVDPSLLPDSLRRNPRTLIYMLASFAIKPVQTRLPFENNGAPLLSKPWMLNQLSNWMMWERFIGMHVTHTTKRHAVFYLRSKIDSILIEGK